MFDIQKFSEALPAFGLMTRADKQKLDSIATDTLITKTAASDTYATKIALKNYIANVVESDTGVAFLNGNGEVVLLVPKMGGGTVNKKSPNLTWTPSAYTVEETGNFDIEVAALSYSGDGAVTVTNKDNNGDDIWTTYENKKLTLHGQKFQPISNDSFDVVANIAETDECESGTATITFSWTWDNPETEVVD